MFVPNHSVFFIVRIFSLLAEIQCQPTLINVDRLRSIPENWYSGFNFVGRHSNISGKIILNSTGKIWHFYRAGSKWQYKYDRLQPDKTSAAFFTCVKTCVKRKCGTILCLFNTCKANFVHESFHQGDIQIDNAPDVASTVNKCNVSSILIYWLNAFDFLITILMR